MMRQTSWVVSHIAVLAVLSFFPTMCLCQTVTEVSSYPSSEPGPQSTPAQGRNGQLFTTSSGFGTSISDGAIFETPLLQKGSRILQSFAGSGGANPVSGLTLATDGNYYGTTLEGGTSGFGVLFKISASGTFTLLHNFTGESDGASPGAAPIEASDGNLYGTTGIGFSDDGTVYRYSPSTGTLSTIFSFSTDGSQGAQLSAPLIQATNGSLYGTAPNGGANGCGTIFELSTSGSLLQLYSFPCGAGGDLPESSLIQASDGNYYGTTFYGGTITSGGECENGCGTIYKMSQGVVSILYTFTGYPDGALAASGLTEGTDGNLYGATAKGGTKDLGALYEINTSGQYKLLYGFVKAVGSGPDTALLQHTNGTFYGTAESGGQYGQGSLYALNMGLGPFVALVRYSGRIGQPVQILGQGLTGTSVVSVNGITAASFTVVSDTYMTAIVPAGATTGPVTVTTPSGTLTSNRNLQIVP